MATIVIGSSVIEKPSERTGEHVFFWAMSALIALIVFVGFARTYYLAGFFGAKPLAAPIVHVHGAVFTCWIVLLLAQTSLESIAAWAYSVSVWRQRWLSLASSSPTKCSTG
jgi:hypothetical protein